MSSCLAALQLGSPPETALHSLALIQILTATGSVSLGTREER